MKPSLFKINFLTFFLPILIVGIIVIAYKLLFFNSIVDEVFFKNKRSKLAFVEKITRPMQIIDSKGRYHIVKTIDKPMPLYNNYQILTEQGGRAFIKTRWNETFWVEPRTYLSLDYNLSKKALYIHLIKGEVKPLLTVKKQSFILHNTTLKPLKGWGPSDTKPLHSPLIVSQKKSFQTPKKEIKHALKHYRQQFLYCQARAMKRKTAPNGRLLVELFLRKGRVFKVYKISSTLNAFMENCTLSVLKKIRLKQFIKKDIKVRYPLVFQ